jgi:hypothetical protein
MYPLFCVQQLRVFPTFTYVEIQPPEALSSIIFTVSGLLGGIFTAVLAGFNILVYSIAMPGLKLAKKKEGGVMIAVVPSAVETSGDVTLMNAQAEMWASRLAAKDAQVEMLETKVNAQAEILQLVLAKLDIK